MSSDDIKSMGRQLRQIEDPKTRALFGRILDNIDATKSSLFALENPEAPGWLDLELQNGWVQTPTIDAVHPKFFKNIYGEVHIRGVISSGTTANGTVIANLPMGFRPLKIETLTILEDTGSGDAHIHITPAGNLEIYRVTASAKVSINCDFYAEN